MIHRDGDANRALRGLMAKVIPLVPITQDNLSIGNSIQAVQQSLFGERFKKSRLRGRAVRNC